MDNFFVQNKYVYTFDCPDVNEPGYVEIKDTSIVLYFPAKSSSTKTELFNQNIGLYINNQLKFTNQWLPIYSLNDFYKVKDMMTKLYYEFRTLNRDYCCYYESQFYQPLYHNNITSTILTHHYNITCFEDSVNTIVDVNFTQNNANNITNSNLDSNINSNINIDNVNHDGQYFLDLDNNITSNDITKTTYNNKIHFQIYIANNLILSSNDFAPIILPPEDYNCLISYMLYKLIKFV
jgi:hypothetical protein